MGDFASAFFMCLALVRALVSLPKVTSSRCVPHARQKQCGKRWQCDRERM